MVYPLFKRSVSWPAIISLVLCSSLPLSFASPLQAQETKVQFLSQLEGNDNSLRQREARRLLALGVEQYKSSQFREAFQAWEQALEIYREIGDRAGEGASLGSLGVAYIGLGEYQQAIDILEQSLVIFREIGDRTGEGQSLGNLGIAHFRLGQYQQSITFSEQSLTIFREIDVSPEERLRQHIREGQSLGNLGIAYANLGQYQQAIDLFVKWTQVFGQLLEISKL